VRENATIKIDLIVIFIANSFVFSSSVLKLEPSEIYLYWPNTKISGFDAAEGGRKVRWIYLLAFKIGPLISGSSP